MSAETPGVPGPKKVVLGDANVLYARVLRDYLVYASDEGAISIRWSAEILDEVVEHLVANRPTFTTESGARLVSLLNAAFPYAQVELTKSAQRRVRRLLLPDEDDRHVLVAAVAADAGILCTDNIKHFPSQVMAEVGIEAMTADALLAHLVREFPTEMLAAHLRTVVSLAGATDESTIAALRRTNAASTADLMTALLGAI